MRYLFQLVEIDNSWRVTSASIGSAPSVLFDKFLTELTSNGWEVITMCPRSDGNGYMFLLRKHY